MSAHSANLVLMGLRGAGKSTIGRIVAAALQREFVDLDEQTAELLGCRTPGVALGAHGEAAFRAAEFRALAAAMSRSGQVIALGGGTPTAPGAGPALAEAKAAGKALLVYLRASADELRSRLASTDTASRPTLTGLGTLNEIETLLAARDPLYLQLASYVEEVAGRSANEIAAELVKLAAMQGQRS